MSEPTKVTEFDLRRANGREPLALRLETFRTAADLYVDGLTEPVMSLEIHPDNGDLVAYAYRPAHEDPVGKTVVMPATMIRLLAAVRRADLGQADEPGLASAMRLVTEDGGSCGDLVAAALGLYGSVAAEALLREYLGRRAAR